MGSTFIDRHVLAEMTEENGKTFLFAIESLIVLNNSQNICFCCYCAVLSFSRHFSSLFFYSFFVLFFRCLVEDLTKC